jgi:signal peptide peptidase SppA
MTTPTFRNSLFALLESYTPHLLAGPEARVPFPKSHAHAGPGIVPIVGVLGQSDWYADTDYAQIREQLRRGVADTSVQKITLVIDSPGGSVIGLPETAAMIATANKIKPVAAHVVGIAASAAYWLASQASTITITPSGEAGSVGVIDLHADISKMLEDSGIKVTPITSAPFKGERAPFTPLSDSARAHMQASVNDWHGQFVAAIHRGRGARVAANSDFGGGRMLSAKAALAAGMIDFIKTETL